MSIYKNAIDSIELGVEDFLSSDERRVLSATRNIVAGVLLLIKNKLQSLSPAGSDEVLIKQRILPAVDEAGSLTWQGEGKKTVDFQQIQERCKKLGISLDAKRLKEIIDYRNSVEHYYNDKAPASVKELLSKSFVIIRDFMRDELQCDPQGEFTPATWAALVDNNDVYEKERLDCINRIGKIDWNSDTLTEALQNVSCPSCVSNLIDVEDTTVERDNTTFRCRSCGTTTSFEVTAERSLSELYSHEYLIAIQDGGDPPFITCPGCQLDTFDLDENCCLVCEESMNRDCISCSNPIPAEELDGSGICGYCAQVRFKND